MFSFKKGCFFGKKSYFLNHSVCFLEFLGGRIMVEKKLGVRFIKGLFWDMWKSLFSSGKTKKTQKTHTKQ